ncbi:putative ribonuclease H-like domain-containing protein [Tanacetum coccineum]
MAERTMEELLRAPTEGEAWERFKELLRACPHHGFMELTQVDTFYNGLNDNEQDSLNAAAGGNLLSKTTREALNIIENKSKVRYSRNKPNASRMNVTSSKTDERIDKLADQLSTLVEIVSKKVVTPAPVKAVEESCVTCGGAHSWYNCPATDNNQASVCATTGTYNQVNPPNRVSNQMAPPGFAPAEAVNTACYVQNRVLVTKPHNNTPYELFLGRKRALGFMKPFRCPVTILNTIDHLGKFDGKADEGFFVSKNAPNIEGSGPNCLFDIDALTISMNYKLVVAGNQSNGNAGTKACDDVGKAIMETVLGNDYILLPLWTADPSLSQNSKSFLDVGSKPLGDNEKKVTKEPRKEGGDLTIDSELNDQEEEDNANSTNNVNDASTNEINVGGGKISIELLIKPDMHELDAIVYSDNDKDVGAEADMNNLNVFMPVNPIPTTRIHKDHLVEQIIGDLNSAPQTRRMTKNLEEHGLFSLFQQRSNHEDFQNYLFACFLSQEKPKKIIHALNDPSWIEAMQEELLQFNLQEVWTLVDLPNGKRAIGTKWVFKNKKNERGILITNKARLVAQGYTQEEVIDYDEIFSPIVRIEAIRLFLACASFKDFVVYQLDVKSAFLYSKIEEEVYVCQPSGFEDPDFPNRVYKVEKTLYKSHQAPRAWY